MSEPGLIERRIVRSFKDYVVVHEKWDLTAPGCPLVAVNLVDPGVPCEVKGVHRTIRMSKEEYAMRQSDDPGQTVGRSRD